MIYKLHDANTQYEATLEGPVNADIKELQSEYREGRERTIDDVEGFAAWLIATKDGWFEVNVEEVIYYPEER